MKRFSLWITAFAFATLSLAGVARADVVGPPQEDCPAGTEGSSCHGGPYCRPVECLVDQDCNAGETCQDRPMCVSTIVCAGLLPPDANPMDYEQAKVEGSCPNGDECAAGATCKTKRLCISNASGGSSSGAGGEGCGCRVAGASDPSNVALLLGAASALALVRRRQRQRRA